MKHARLQAMTVDELVDRFAEIGIAQDQALLYNEISKFTKLYWQMKDVDTELRGRGDDARRTLPRLYNHPNMQVRLQAAARTLAVAPHAARQVIVSISESNWFPQAGEAGMTLSNLDSGIFKPN
jgi:phage pi2 protein 07